MKCPTCGKRVQYIINSTDPQRVVFICGNKDCAKAYLPQVGKLQEDKKA
jgi:hypothetical protein